MSSSKGSNGCANGLESASHKGSRSRIAANVLSTIGETPLVRLNKIPAMNSVKDCEILVKCEFMNPGGSVKDRAASRMIQDAESSGRIHPHVTTLIESTSGNTGIGLAMVAAVKGYECIIVMPTKSSQEKEDIVKRLGAKVVRTKGDPHSLAREMQQQIPGSVILDQYRNPSNPAAHFDSTAEEILSQCDGRLDAVVISGGTCGTLTGIGRKIKQRVPGCKVVAVDAKGSILTPDGQEKQPWLVEGLGCSWFIPETLDSTVVDEWIRVSDEDSFRMARDVIKEEGLLVGGSSGSAVVAAIQVARRLGRDKRVVAILPDGVTNYLSTFLNDGWMLSHGFPIES